MVVYLVTLFMRVTMRRPTAFSTALMSFAGALALVAAVSCDTYTTSTMQTPDGSIRVRVHPTNFISYTAAQKDSISAASIPGSSSTMVPLEPISNVVGASKSAAASAAACGSGTGTFNGYSKSKPEFAWEDTPNVVPYPVLDDMFIPDSDVPLGFSFNFQGQTYDKVNVSSNGLLLFGTVPSTQRGQDGYPGAGPIPSTSAPNNIIAVAWADWQDDMVPDPIRWETRGTAPNRRFILQYNNIPEYNDNNSVGAISPQAGRLTAQVVLSEGSNDITINTMQMSTSRVVLTNRHTVTQGIEDATGSVANFDTFWSTDLLMDQPRVQRFFSLQRDAVRFSLIASTDVQKPAFTLPLPANDSVDNDPGANYAMVVITPPTATDNCGDSNVTIAGTRSDAKPIDAPYPVGITTITWTASDRAENAVTTSQDIHVYDVEAPVWDMTNTASVWTVDATSPSGALVEFDNVPVTDNVGVTARSCEPAAGSLFPMDTTPVKCTAWDAAGNNSSISFLVVVVNAHLQIGNLIDWVKSRNFPDGTVQPLVNQLQSASDDSAGGSPACKKMYDFMSMVQKKNSNISTGDAAYMLNAGSKILAVMGCAPASNSDVIRGKVRGGS